MSNIIPEADFKEVQEYLQALVAQLSTRKAAIALGWAPTSYSSLVSLYTDYSVNVPERTNQFTDTKNAIDPRTGEIETTFDEEIEYNADTEGYKSTKLVEMSLEELKDTEYLLHAHGFDPAVWELVGAKHKRWNAFSKGERIDVEGNKTSCHDISTLYSSSISVRPIKNRFDIEKIVEICRSVEPLKGFWICKEAPAAHGLLEFSYHDMHFGISDFQWYSSNLERSIGVLKRRTYEEVLITIGSDLFHNDNFKGQTSNGTQIEPIEFPSAWSDATKFFSTLIVEASGQSLRVVVKFIKGNHDESMTWAFCHMLAAMFPNVEFDLEIEERKVHSYGEICLGFTHGDKGGANLDRSFMAQFPEFASAKVREIHTGHYHHEMAKDQFGVLIRTLSTAVRTDTWHKDKGFVGCCKRFMVFDFNKTCLDSITYV